MFTNWLTGTTSNSSGIGSGSGALSDTQTQSQRTKLYQSVFDLSPEYCGLPFVKRLKILNERQKLAELEKALQTRSFSLDCSKTRTNNDDDGVGGVGVGMPETLYRCYSDTSGIYSQFMTATYESTTSSTTSSASASVSDNPKQQQQQQQQPQQQQQQHQLESVQQEYVPLSPESNETFERRKLKSILKKLHKSRDSITTTTTTAAVPTAAAAGATTTTAMRAPTISETYGIGINDNAMKRNNDYGNGNGNGNGNRIGMERDGNETIRGNATVNMRDNNSQVKASAQRGLLKEPTLEGPPGSADSNICAFGQHQQQQQQQQNQRVIEHSGGVGGDGVETLTAPGLQINASALTIPFSSGSSSGISSGAAGGGGGGVSYVSGSAINSGGNNNNTSNNAFGNFTEIAWSSPPTALALVAATTTTTPTNSPQDAQFTFDQQQQQLQQQQLQQQQQLFTFNAASSSSGVGNNVTGSTAETTVDDGGVDVGSGGIVVGGIAYAAECSNKILTNTAFHAQSCTDLNLNLQLRQNTNSSSMSQVPRIEGFPEAQDYFNQILCGINDVIKTHMNDMHSKFELQFTNMASEVRRRDAIIQQLQLKLRTIETKAQSGSTPSRRRNRERIGHEEHEHERAQLENSSSGSSAELLFMRGDSLDTVFTSSPPMQGDRRGITSPGTSKHGATASASAANYGGIGYAAQQHRNGQQRSSSLHGGSSSKRTRDWAVESARSLGNISGIGGVSGGAVMIADVTGNLARISDSVILDIGESSSSSSSSSKIHIAEADDDEDDDDDDNEADVMRRRRHRDDVEDDNIDIGTVHIADDNDDDDDDDDDDDGVVAVTAGVRQHVHHNDWEVQMLAAEMERQERRRRGHSLSDNLGELKHCSSFLRRRRKFSDTETECSEPDMEEHASAATAATATTTRAGLSSSSSIAAISSTAGASAAAASTTTAQQQQPSSAPTTTRPRASSLDQFNLRYGIGRGIFKAMSIDRDKDKL